MKTLLFIFFLLSCSTQSQAQPQPKPVDTTHIKGKVYPVYQGSRGGQYIIVTSKTGTTYKKYLPKKPFNKTLTFSSHLNTNKLI